MALKYDVLVDDTVVATTYTALDQILLRDFYRKMMSAQGFAGYRVWGRTRTQEEAQRLYDKTVRMINKAGGAVYQIERTDAEVDEVLNQASASADQGSRWPGMSYEDGVSAAIRWLIGEADENPMEE